MTLPVTPPDRALPHAHLVIDKERRGSLPNPSHEQPHFESAVGEPVLDRVAPVSVGAETGAALAELDPIDTVPLATAISRYREG